MKDFCIVGSGIAGTTIANLLSKDYTVEIFDKARGPGGRASNRRYKKDLSFDHGLQYISPKTKIFKKFLTDLERKKILKKWFGNHLDFTLVKKEKSHKYIGVKGNNAIPKYLIKKIRTNYLSLITNVSFNSDYWTVTINNKEKINFRNLILTCPFPQIKSFNIKYLNKQLNKSKPIMVPNITVLAVYKNYSIMPISSIKFQDKIIAWAVNENSKKRFKSKESLWTLQCTENYSKKVIDLFKDNKKKYVSEILKKFEKLTGFKLKNIIFKNIHGWKYAHNKNLNSLKCLWNKKNRLGVCADWLNGPHAEDAWLSAKTLYKQVKKNPATIK